TGTWNGRSGSGVSRREASTATRPRRSLEMARDDSRPPSMLFRSLVRGPGSVQEHPSPSGEPSKTRTVRPEADREGRRNVPHALRDRRRTRSLVTEIETPLPPALYDRPVLEVARA